jgi:MFS family permease
MNPDQLADDVRKGWQSQAPAMTPLTVSLLRRVARRFDRRSHLEDLVAITGQLALVIFFAAAAWFGVVTLCRIGCALFAAATLYTIYRYVDSCWKDWSPTERALECFDFYRAQLIRRRDFALGFAHWGSLPSVPGVAIGCAGWILAEPRRWPEAVGIAVFWIGLQIAVQRKQRDVARRLQREIELLDGAAD